jgi:hypothetical protein
LDIEYALSKTVEERLWTNGDYRVIEDYKKRIANVRSCDVVNGSMKEHMERLDQLSIAS